MSEPAEWQLPWWLRFLDRTNLTVTALTATSIVLTRSAGAAYFSAGAVACSISVKVVKRFVRQPRPVLSADSGRRLKKSYGMPSTHAATITYFGTYIPLACIYLPIHHSLPQHVIMRVLPPLVVVPLASLIAASRVWLGHHTWIQVIAGCLYGVTFAFLWFGLWTRGINEYGMVQFYTHKIRMRISSKAGVMSCRSPLVLRFRVCVRESRAVAFLTSYLQLPQQQIMDEDPITQFFPGEESVDLYAVLSVTSSAKPDDIKKAYRRLALQYHPDKHATASESAKNDASTKFQQIGFAYTILSDEKRRQRYDRTGKTDEGFDLASGDDGWEAYFEDLFDRVTRGKLDEMKQEYQGSSEEVEDLKAAYNETKGSIGDIMMHIPHSTHDDEARFIVVISDLISKGELESLPQWQSTIKDEKARLVRKKQGEKEAQEAEKLAKELGVWDEFYGSGKTGQRKSKGKGKSTSKEDIGEDEEDVSALQALILKKKQKNMDSFFDGLAAKYAEPAPKTKGKKRAKPADEDEEESLPKKRSRKATAPPDIDDEQFEKLQQRLFGDKAKASEASASTKGKGRKGKAK